MKACEIRVTGRVQGVFFRRAARDKALALGLSGFAKNEPDGSVRLELEGPEKALDDFAAWCRGSGPDQAWVRTLERKDKETTGATGFSIL